MFVQDYDRLKTGFVTPQQLVKSFSQVRIGLLDGEIEKIFEVYGKVLNSRQVVDYRKLGEGMANFGCKDGKEEFMLRGGFSKEQLELLNQILGDFTHFAKQRRLYITHFFENFDKLKVKKVTPKQFKQVLQSNSLATSSE